jgi:hypothetical protein
MMLFQIPEFIFLSKAKDLYIIDSSFIKILNGVKNDSFKVLKKFY